MAKEEEGRGVAVRKRSLDPEGSEEGKSKKKAKHVPNTEESLSNDEVESKKKKKKKKKGSSNSEEGRCDEEVKPIKKKKNSKKKKEESLNSEEEICEEEEEEEEAAKSKEKKKEVQPIKKKKNSKKKKEEPSNSEEEEEEAVKSKEKKKGSKKKEESLDRVKSKKKKKKYVVSLGYNNIINERHKAQLAILGALVTSKKTELIASDSMQKFLESDANNAAIFMEWSEEEETYFIHSASPSGVVKFEMLVVADYEHAVEEIEINNPLLMFSKGFGNGSVWEETKTVLHEVFSKPDDSASCAQDYIYAFTRISDRIYIRIYKINSLPCANDEGSFEQIFATFVLKPVEIQSQDRINYFFDNKRFSMLVDNPLLASSVSCGKIQHEDLHLSIQLPAPYNLSEWEGFNTNVPEYFDRFHLFRHSKVPGTGPEKIPEFGITFQEEFYWHLCLPFKVFARSLIICAGSTFKSKACYMTIKEENIFLRRKSVKILGTDLTEYTLEKAVSNLNDIGLILESILMKMGLETNNFPGDLAEVMRLLLRNPFTTKGILADENPVQDYEIIVNHISWMDGSERSRVINDLLHDFLYRLGPADQLNVGKSFPPFNQWANMFDQDNFLLKICRRHNLPKNKTQAEMNKWFQSKMDALLECVNHVAADASLLYSRREYFRTINNCLKHLLETCLQKEGIELSPDEIDLIVSSKCAATYARVQADVPKTIAIKHPADDKASYQRFARFFPHVDGIRFKPEDKKG